MKRFRGLIGFGSYEMTARPVTRSVMQVGALGVFPAIPATCEPCPEGQYGCVPYCYGVPTWGGDTTPPGENKVPGTGGTCPEGQVGIPPACAAIPALPGVPAVPGQTPPPAVPAQQQAAVEPSPKSWWGKLTDTEKWVVVGLGTLGGVALLALLRGASRPRYAANLRGKPGRKVHRVPIVKGKRWGRASAPKKYRTLGAKHPSDFAYPSRFMYPVVFRRSDGTVNAARSRRHVASGKGYFTKHKRCYPVGVRRTIARNLNRAARRFGLRPDVRA